MLCTYNTNIPLRYLKGNQRDINFILNTYILEMRFHWSFKYEMYISLLAIPFALHILAQWYSWIKKQAKLRCLNHEDQRCGS